MRHLRFVIAVFIVVAPGLARAESSVTLRMGTLAIEGSRYMKDIRALSERIEDRTGGKVKLKWYPGGRLGDEPTMVDQMRDGHLDGGAFSDVGLVAMVPQMRAWQYPGLFRDYDEVDRATDALDADVRALFDDADTVFVMWADLGFSQLFSTDEVATWSDFLAQTLWFDAADDGPAYATDALGASTKLASEDGTFAAIAAGTATAWVMPPLYALASSAHAKARYLWALRYRYVLGGLVIERSAWSRLSDDQQAAFLDVCKRFQPSIRKRWRRETRKAIAAIGKSGVTRVGVSKADKQAFFSRSEAGRDTYAKKWGLGDLMDAIVEAIEP